MTLAYAPARDPVAKVTRRMTQWRAARPAFLAFERPMLSVTFDDFPASAAEFGAATLESFGARGTFYASAGLADQEGPCGRGFTPAQLRALANAGHEIGCHTHSHRDCARLDPFETLRDLAKNRDALAAMGFDTPMQALAYPYGETTTALKEALPPRYLTARGALPGINLGRTDLAQLRAYPLFGKGATARAHAALQHAAKRNAWIVAFTHDVGASPSPWGTQIGELSAFLAAARHAGFAILPVTDVLKHARA